MNTSDQVRVSIIIPNYNGHDVLKKNLPILLDTVEKENHTVEVIVVDDASNDESIQFLKTCGHNIRVIEKKENQGFSVTCNTGARSASGDLLFFLNNDMSVSDILIQPLVDLFNSDDIFAVAPSSVVKNHDGNIDETPVGGDWENGILKIFSIENKNQEPIEIFHAHGGCMMVRKDRFIDMGGFDERFSPFYFEDVDLCWRAKERGWRVVHQPAVKVYHHSHYTIDRTYDARFSKTVYWKNYFLFLMKTQKQISVQEIADYVYHHNRIGETVLLGFKIALRQYLRDF